MMRRFRILSLTALSVWLSSPAGLIAQETAAPPPAAESGTISPESADKQARFAMLINEAQVLHSQQSFLDALSKVQEADALQPGTAIVPNVEGSIYTAMRDYDKARTAFQKAHELNAGAFEPKFNLAELNYVQGNYKQAEEDFGALIKTYPKLRQEVRHLTYFKILVSQLKQDKLEAAEETAKVFTFMDDTPAYYYAKAAFAFQKKELGAAQEWVVQAANIFQQPAKVIPYLDTLMEARWIESLAVSNDTAK